MSIVLGNCRERWGTTRKLRGTAELRTALFAPNGNAKLNAPSVEDYR